MYDAEQNYYSTRRQEYVDSYRLQNNTLAARIAESTPADIAGSPLTIPMMKGLINDQYRYFNEIVKLEQSIEINTNLFQETSVSINKLIDSITSKSSSSGIQTRAAITAQGRQATITIIVASVVVLVLGVTIGAIYSITLARPIHQLANAAAEMGAGKLDEKVSIRGPREINQLADNFNTMAGQLAETLAGLESRVEERTKALARRSTQLQASAEVARDATSIRDLNVLLNQTANLIRERFGFYHAGIFLVDPKHEYAILRASTGEAGREMLSRKHKLKVGETGIVGRVCATGEPLISLDVGAEAVHFRNPLLPDTRSEMALPLKAGRLVIGAIDVQSTEPAAFDEQDVAVLQSMADQLAVAIENARLFSESQENIQQLQTIYGSYSKKAWDVITATRKQFGYAYEDGQLVPLTEGKTESAPLSIPLAVRGQEIGSLEIWPNEHGLSENDRAVIVSLGDRIGQAMESARLYEEAQSRATREQSLSQLTAMFTRSLSFETILKTAVQELGKMPNVTEASIQLEIPEQEER
jgi:nitrate/nitrite-specific signal transduction histidine kinase